MLLEFCQEKVLYVSNTWLKRGGKSSMFKCYFSEELIAMTVPTGFEPATYTSQSQSAIKCTNREGDIQMGRN